MIDESEVVSLTPKGWQLLAEVDRREAGLGRRMTDEEAEAFMEGWDRVLALLDGRYEECACLDSQLKQDNRDGLG